MLGKSALGYDPATVPAGKRLRQNLLDLVLSNDISSARAQALFDDAATSGVADCEAFAGIGGHGNGRRGTCLAARISAVTDPRHR